MVRPPFLVLHKTEWERLQRQGGPPPEEPVNVKNEYLTALTEQSQEWMKSWPDTVIGHVAQLEKQKKSQRQANIAFIKAYSSQKKQKGTQEAIKEAKKSIFKGTSYGRQLLSALLESRAIEVREKQIAFNKELEKKAIEIAKEEEAKNKNVGINAVYNNDAEREKTQKLKALECIEVNKEIVTLKKKKELESAEKEKKCAVQDEKIMEQVLQIGKQKKEDIKRCVEQSIKEYEAEKAEIKKVKTKEKQFDEALIDIYKRGQDRIKCKIRATMKEINHGKPETKWSKDLYRKIEGIHATQKMRYDDFVDIGVKRYEERISKNDKKDLEKEKQKSSTRYLISQKNKITAEEEKQVQLCANKCHCDRQSLVLKTAGKARNMPESEANNMPIARKKKIVQKPPTKTECDTVLEKNNKLTFLAPRNQLLEKLRKRENEPTPWTAAAGAHAQFAQEASEVLKEAKHKHFARKVVDEYRKLNCLDANTLPVPNY